MFKIILVLLTLTFSVLSFADDITRNYNNKDFTEVNVCCGMKLRLNKGENYSVKVMADQRDFQFLTVDQNGSKLRIYINKNNYKLRSEIRVEITMPDLEALGLSGGSLGNLNMETSRNVSLDLSGGAILKGSLVCANLDMDLSGGSQVNLKGSGRNLELNGSGGSMFVMKEFSVKNVESNLSGGSMVKIAMDGTLNTSQSGGSQLTFYGTAKIGRTSFSGGSGVSKGD
jgi:hypothetical protein